MKWVEQIEELRELLEEERIARKTIGLVPTMGYLHRGHQSLIEQAKKECDVVVVSIFVNPLQFGPNEDFERYPRDLHRDQQLAEQAGADFIFYPSAKEMYPSPVRTFVEVEDLTTKLCGRTRPGHFRGVTTVVSKLFHIVQPHSAFFGLKDAQQVAVIQQMVNDLNIPVEIVPCPIVREEDGLALSSRNVYLNSDERKQALALSQGLIKAKQMLMSGETNLTKVTQEIEKLIKQMPLAKIDYVEVLSFPSLEEVKVVKPNDQIILAVAVWFGKTRLIDNLIYKNEHEIEV